MFECLSMLVRALLRRHTCSVLEELGKGLMFEIVEGLNGQIWVNGHFLDSRSTVKSHYVCMKLKVALKPLQRVHQS
jgi:exosome complex RNA-binding protein Rrp4